MGAPYLIVPILGDSNAGSGETYDSGNDVANARVVQQDREFPSTIISCTEPNLENDTHGNLSMGSTGNKVGSTLKMCQNLVTRGMVPPGYDVMIVGVAQAGTTFNDYWSVSGHRYCLDTGSGGGLGLHPLLQAALAQNAGNRIWFWDWNQGCNDAVLISQSQYQTEAINLFAEFRSVYPQAAYAPVLIAGCPPNKQDAALGNIAAIANITAAQIALGGGLIDNAYYVDPTGLQSNISAGFIHFSAASHRGGVDTCSTVNAARASNSWYWSAGDNTAGNYTSGSFVIDPTDQFCYKKTGASGATQPSLDGGVNWTKTTWQYGQTVTNSLAERKYAALINSGKIGRTRITCNTAVPGSISDLTATAQYVSLSLAYTASSGASSYQYRIRPTGGNGVWSVPATLVSNTLSGLTAGTAYDVQIRGVVVTAGLTIYGSWSNVSSATPAQINLSAAQDIQGAAQGTAIGTLSVTGGSGTYTFTLTGTAGGTAQVAGTHGVNLQDGATPPSVGTRSITVHADNGAGSAFSQSFTLTTVPQAPTIALVSGTVSPYFDVTFLTTPAVGDVVTIKDNGSVVATHTLTSGDLSGGTVELGLSNLATGTHSITVQHTQSSFASADSSALVITI